MSCSLEKKRARFSYTGMTSEQWWQHTVAIIWVETNKWHAFTASARQLHDRFTDRRTDTECQFTQFMLTQLNRRLSTCASPPDSLPLQHCSPCRWMSLVERSLVRCSEGDHHHHLHRHDSGDLVTLMSTLANAVERVGAVLLLHRVLVANTPRSAMSQIPCCANTSGSEIHTIMLKNNPANKLPRRTRRNRQTPMTSIDASTVSTMYERSSTNT